MKKISVLIICCFALLAIGCNQQQPPADTRAADENAIKNADMDWSDKAKTLEGILSYFLDDAVVLISNEPAVSGREAISNKLNEMYAMPGFKVKWQPIMVEVASSGDIGYSRGAYDLSVNDSLGSPMSDKGKYITIWKKQSDGSWKVAVDMFSSDLPMH